MEKFNLGSQNTRDGIEDTRIEAKAKDKKTPRPTTALQRTDPLEAKDRNARGQGQRRKCSPKKRKKRSSKEFFRRSHKNRSSK